MRAPEPPQPVITDIPTQPIPDMAERNMTEHFGNVVAANTWAIKEYRERKNTPQHKERVALLNSGLDAVRKQADEIPQSEIDEMKAKKKRGLEMSVGESLLEQAANILAQHPKTVKPVIILDCDDTATNQDVRVRFRKEEPYDFDIPLHKDEQPIPSALNGHMISPDIAKRKKLNYLETIAGSNPAEAAMEDEGRGAFPEVFAGIWEPLMREKPELFAAAGKNFVSLRNGIQEFFNGAKNEEGELAYDIVILSANFEPFVISALSQIKGADDFPKLAVKIGDITSTEKAAMVRLIAAGKVANPHNRERGPVIFLGDGSSDECILDDPLAKDSLVAMGAIEGKSLHKRLKNEPDILSFSFTDFKEIKKMMDILDVRAEQIRNQPSTIAA